jgi:hypothetical protein
MAAALGSPLHGREGQGLRDAGVATAAYPYLVAKYALAASLN